MTATVAGLRARLERGYAMRAQRMVEGLLLVVAILSDDLRPAYVAFGMLAAQAVTPFAAPVALVWALVVRGLPPDRLGNLYYDLAGSRGAAAISAVVIGAALLLIHAAGLPVLGRLLLGAPCASCILAATVGFCAGCGYYVLGRELLVRAGVVRGAPEGATDVDIEPR